MDQCDLPLLQNSSPLQETNNIHAVEFEIVKADRINSDRLPHKANISPFLVSTKSPCLSLNAFDLSPPTSPTTVEGSIMMNSAHQAQSITSKMTSTVASSPPWNSNAHVFDRVRSWHDLMMFLNGHDSPSLNGQLHQEAEYDFADAKMIEHHNNDELEAVKSLLDEFECNRNHTKDGEHIWWSATQMQPFFGRQVSPFKYGSNPQSPIVIDKKILVTENDLKIRSSSPSTAVNTVTSCRKKASAPSNKAQKRLNSPKPVLVSEKPRKRHHIAPKQTTSAKRGGNKKLKSGHRQENPRYREHAATKAEYHHPLLPWSNHNELQEQRHVQKHVSSQSLGISGKSLSYKNATPSISRQWKREHSNAQPTSPLPFAISNVAQHLVSFSRAESASAVTWKQIGIYTPEQRRERIKRFHAKRKLRVYHKRIKYDCRMRLANASPRFQGRFVKKIIESEHKNALNPLMLQPDEI